MELVKTFLWKIKILRLRRAAFSYSLILLFSAFGGFAAEGAPATRGRPVAAVARAPVAATATTIVAAVAKSAAAAEPEEVVEEEEVIVEEPALVAAASNTNTEYESEEDDPGVENKNLQFGARFGMVADDSDGAETPLQKMIREQREKLFGTGVAETAAKSAAQNKNASLGKDTAIQCDEDLRGCMAKKCGGADWKDCWKDGDTDFGMKLDSCRRETKCSGEEYNALAIEIRADREQNSLLSRFGETIACGKNYNNCLTKFCGDEKYSQCIERNGDPARCRNFANSYQKCWSKSGGDKAIASCAAEYKKCQEADSGLQARAMDLFAALRVDLEKNVLEWEAELYKLRDSMTNMCKMQDGMFDNRSLQCVYTVELFADNDGKSTQFASKKMHGGETYACNPDSFGIDITTFKENAYRLTRAQTAASSAMMGAGVGTGVGALTSGAIGRAIDSAKAAKEAKNAEENMAGSTENASNTADDATKAGGDGGGQSTVENPGNNPDLPAEEQQNQNNDAVAEEIAPVAQVAAAPKYKNNTEGLNGDGTKGWDDFKNGDIDANGYNDLNKDTPGFKNIGAHRSQPTAA